MSSNTVKIFLYAECRVITLFLAVLPDQTGFWSVQPTRAVFVTVYTTTWSHWFSWEWTEAEGSGSRADNVRHRGTTGGNSVRQKITEEKGKKEIHKTAGQNRKDNCRELERKTNRLLERNRVTTLKDFRGKSEESPKNSGEN